MGPGLALMAAALITATLAGCETNSADEARLQQPTPPPIEEVIAPLEEEPPEVVAEEELAPVEPAPVVNLPLDGSIRVGFLVPLSGRHRAVGEALLRAAELALFDLADDRFMLLVGDTRGTPGGARSAARDLLDQGAQLLIGPLFAESVLAVGEETLYRNVSVIGISNDLSVARPNVYVMGSAPESQVERVVTFAAAQGHRRLATLLPDNDFGRRILAALQESAQLYSLEIAALGLYDPMAEDLAPDVIRVADYDRRHKDLLRERKNLKAQGDATSKAMLRRLEKLDTLEPPDYDAILLPMGGRTLLTLASLFAFYDVDPVDIRYLGTSLWQNPGFTKEPTLHGGWFPAGPPTLWEGFRDRYREIYGQEPPRIATIGYDTTALAAVLARRVAAPGNAALGGPFGPETLRNPNGFAGIDGIFRLLPDGKVERVYAVMEMTAEGFAEVEPAPQTFEVLAF